MKLFNDTELFTTGSGGKKIFDLPDTELILIDNFFSKEESDHFYEKLLHQTKWSGYQMEFFNKTVTSTRMIAWYEDKNNIGADQNGPDWTYDLLTIRSRIEKETKLDFNSLLLNLYRNGKDSVGWHSDTENDTDKNPVIASVTFGDTRIFKLRHRFRKDIAQIEIPLHHGSFLLMAGTTNSFWQHQIPKTAKNVLPRINLTFRKTERKTE